MNPRALDLYCGAGGVTEGLKQAGFDVVGVDIEFQPRYPTHSTFVHGDALNIKGIETFDFIWASPPCQAHSPMRNAPKAKKHVSLIGPTRLRLAASGLPYVIENVPGAPLINPVCLCGSMFGLGAAGHQLRRHRLFECSFPAYAPHCRHNDGPVIGLYGGHVRCRSAKHGGRGTRDFIGRDKPSIAREAMRIDWMTMTEMSQAIPPAYARFIGEQAIKFIKGAKSNVERHAIAAERSAGPDRAAHSSHEP